MNDLIEKAKEMGVSVIEFTREDGKSVAQLSRSGVYRYIIGTLIPLNTSASAKISKSKQLTKDVLSKQNIQTPRGIITDKTEGILELLTASDIKLPVVVKPNDAALGKNVHVNINSMDEVIDALKTVLSDTPYALIEEFLPYQDHRVLVVDGVMIAACKRIPPMVTGDGIHTLKELITMFNQTRDGIHIVTIDPELERFTKAQGATLETVVPNGKIVTLRGNANVRTGGSVEDVTPTISPFFEQLAITASKALGMRLAGVDILTNDITASETKDYVITEVNGLPSYDIHMMASTGEKRDPRQAIIEAIFKEI